MLTVGELCLKTVLYSAYTVYQKHTEIKAESRHVELMTFFPFKSNVLEYIANKKKMYRSLNTYRLHCILHYVDHFLSHTCHSILH